MTWNTFYSYGYHLLVFANLIISGAALVNTEECGDFSIEEPAILGKNVTFTFTPTAYDANATLLWQRTNKHNPWSTLPRDSKFVQSEKNGIYYLIVTDTVFTEKENDAVYYRIQYYNKYINCTMGTPKLALKVAPDPPVFEYLTNIDACQNCIVCKDKSWCKIYCRISGGTEPKAVTMSIETNGKIPTIDHRTGYYAANFLFGNKQHMTRVNCSVKNDALMSPITTTATVYVTKQPTFLGCEKPRVFREGESVNITCTFAAGRPTPTLSFKTYSGTKLLPVQQTNTLNTTDRTYSSVISLTTFERIWSGYISCCRYSPWYQPTDKCEKLGHVKYLFPPSDLKLQIISKGRPTQIEAVCTIYGAKPACTAKWQAPIGSIHSERNSKTRNKSYEAWNSEYTVSVNTSQYHHGEKITCSPDCSDFTISMEKSDFLPYALALEFNISDSVLDIYKGNEAHVKCTARSSPSSNISWIEHTDSGIGIELKQCQLETDCDIAIEGDNKTQRNLSCNTKHLLGSDTKKLTINIIEKKPTSAESQDGTASADNSIYWIILGAVVGVVAITAVATLIVRKKRRDTKAASHSGDEDAVRYNDQREEPNNGRIGTIAQASVTAAASNAASSDDATYSQIDKSRRRNVATKNPMEGGQLVYADLGFESSDSKPLQGAVAHRRDSPTEYVGIDFVKTAEGQVQGNESNEMVNIYSNQ